MTTAIKPPYGAISILIVDDSAVFRLMVLRDLMNKGFAQTGEAALKRGNLTIFLIESHSAAMSLLLKGSPRHVDFSAVFLDWHLSKAERAAELNGAQLAAFALDHANQPLDPVVYCLSADARDMIAEIRGKTGLDRAQFDARVKAMDFLYVVSKILEITSPASPPNP